MHSDVLSNFKTSANQYPRWGWLGLRQRLRVPVKITSRLTHVYTRNDIHTRSYTYYIYINREGEREGERENEGEESIVFFMLQQERETFEHQLPAQTLTDMYEFRVLSWHVR